jgi:hypothetical protein
MNEGDMQGEADFFEQAFDRLSREMWEAYQRRLKKDPWEWPEPPSMAEFIRFLRVEMVASQARQPKRPVFALLTAIAQFQLETHGRPMKAWEILWSDDGRKGTLLLRVSK